MIRQPLQWLFSVGGPLRSQVIRGGIWLVMSSATLRAAGLLKLAVLGRLLSPSDFGLMGIALLMLTWLEYFTETGFNYALIRKAGDIRPYLNTVLTIQILRCTALALVMYAAAPLGGWFFANPDAVPVIRAVAVLLVVKGFTNPAFVYLRKDLDFRKITVCNASSAGTGLVVGLLAAFAYRNAWALVLSLAAAQVAGVVASWALRPYRPRLEMRWERSRELFAFGRWVASLNLVNFLCINLDSLAVGRLLGVGALGLYQVATQCSVLATAEIQSVVFGVTLPAFAKLRQGADERESRRRTRAAFLQTLALVSSLVIPIGCFITVFAEPLVRLALGDQWQPIAPLLQILVWSSVATTLTGTTASFFYSIKQPRVPMRASLLRITMIAGLLYPMIVLSGLNGAALAMMIATVLAMLTVLIAAARVVEPTWSEVLKTFKVGAIGALPFLAAGLVAPSALSVALLVTATVAIGAYLAILLAAMRTEFGLTFRPWMP